MFSGAWWDLVLNVFSGGGFCEFSQHLSSLSLLLAAWKGPVKQGRGSSCPMALYGEGTWAGVGAGPSQGKSKRPSVGFSAAELSHVPASRSQQIKKTL